jgi:hypothetical protein
MVIGSVTSSQVTLTELDTNPGKVNWPPYSLVESATPNLALATADVSVAGRFAHATGRQLTPRNS